MSVDFLSRRDMLRAAGGSVAAGVASLAGCVMSVPGVERSNAWAWFPVPDELDLEHYAAYYVDMQALRSKEEYLADDDSSTLVSEVPGVETLGIDADDVTDWYSTFSGVPSVLGGSYDTDDIADELDDQGFDEDTDGSFSVYEKPDARVYAVKRNAIILGNDEDEVEVFADVNRGEADRYAEANDDFSRGASVMGGGAINMLRTHEETVDTDVTTGLFEHSVATGWNVQINEETSKQTWIRVFETSGDIDIDDLEEWTEEDARFAAFNDVTVSKRGRVGVVEGTIDTDEVD